jgi:hypothetical protein
MTLDLPATRGLWADVMGKPPPSTAGLAFLRCNLAWHIQARKQGFSPIGLRRRLGEEARKAGGSVAVGFKPGTRLIREWQGQTHEVTVLEEGYEWQGVRYRSLSPIACAITGSRWSGPRFFGTDS